MSLLKEKIAQLSEILSDYKERKEANKTRKE
jgi:hypothetical protein